MKCVFSRFVFLFCLAFAPSVFADVAHVPLSGADLGAPRVGSVANRLFHSPYLAGDETTRSFESEPLTIHCSKAAAHIDCDLRLQGFADYSSRPKLLEYRLTLPVHDRVSHEPGNRLFGLFESIGKSYDRADGDYCWVLADDFDKDLRVSATRYESAPWAVEIRLMKFL